MQIFPGDQLLKPGKNCKLKFTEALQFNCFVPKFVREFTNTGGHFSWKKRLTHLQSKHLPSRLQVFRVLDEITFGGLPKGRPTLICGNAGCGKTLLAMEFLVRGATKYNEPGVFMAFEETIEELATNVSSLGFDLNELIAQKKLFIDHVHIERSEIEVTGEYDLEGLFRPAKLCD